VRTILVVQGEAIDFAHIEHWCAQHGTRERLAEVRAGIPPEL
jgi:transposase